MTMRARLLSYLSLLLLCRGALAASPSPLPCDAYGYTCPLYSGASCTIGSYGSGPWPLDDSQSSTSQTQDFTCNYYITYGLELPCYYDYTTGANYNNEYGACCPSVATCGATRRRRGGLRKEIVFPPPIFDVVDNPDDPNYSEDAWQPW